MSNINLQIILFINCILSTLLVIGILQLYKRVNQIISNQDLIDEHHLFGTELGIEKSQPIPIVELKTLTGDIVNLEESSKEKLLVFTSTNCSACKRLYPEIYNFVKNNPKIEVVHFQYSTDPQSAEKIAQKYGLSNNYIVADNDLLDLFMVYSIPFAYFVDEKLIIRSKATVNIAHDIEELIKIGRAS